MRKYRLLMPILLGLVASAGSIPAAMAAYQDVQVPAANPGAARVWFLRPAGANSYALGAAPMIYANGRPVADIPANAAFYRDFAPGTYRFTVQPYGSRTKKADTQMAQDWLPALTVIGQR
jgi:hypothetical protein